jgi:hypothetical protein
MPRVSDDLMASFFAESEPDGAEELNDNATDNGPESTPQDSAPQAQASQEPEASQAPATDATPALLSEVEQRVARLETSNRQFQGQADSAQARAAAAERQVAILTAERDGYVAVLKEDQVELTPERRELIALRAKEAGSAVDTRVPAPTRAEIEAQQQNDRAALIEAFKDAAGVDASKVNNLGLELYTAGDGSGFLRHILAMAVAPYKALLAKEAPQEPTAQQRRNTASRVPRQNANGAGAADWQNKPLHELDARALITEGLREEAARGS